jgi:pSer/pThr/pTyr-binding forkhead associated (FHA) protein
MEALLIPIDGGKTIRLEKDVTLVGRRRGLCDLVIDKGSISKLQCLIVKTDGLLFIRDLASTNGTKVNGQRIMRGALLPGDELAFASVKYKVHLGPDRKTSPREQDRGTEVMSEVSEARSDGDIRDVESFQSDSDVRLAPD